MRLIRFALIPTISLQSVLRCPEGRHCVPLDCVVDALMVQLR